MRRLRRHKRLLVSFETCRVEQHPKSSAKVLQLVAKYALLCFKGNKPPSCYEKTEKNEPLVSSNTDMAQWESLLRFVSGYLSLFHCEFFDPKKVFVKHGIFFK